MELIESNFELLTCGEPCSYHHPPPPLWRGKSINPTCILHTLVRIMKDPMAEDQVKRQLYLLTDLKLGLRFGFWVRDIENSTKLIEILLCKGEYMPIFFEYAKYLLSLMRFPPLMCRTNEILDYHRDVQGYFDFFGYMLVTSPKLTVRQTIIQCLKKLIAYENTIKMHSMPLDMLKKEITQSNLPVILVKYMELCTNDVYHELIHITTTLASFSTTLALILLKAGCLQTIMMRLDPQWQDHIGGPRPHYDTFAEEPESHTEDSIMLLYTLLEILRKYPEKAKEVATPRAEALWGLRYAFIIYTINGYCNERNFMGALYLLLAQCFPGALYFYAGIVQDIAVLSTIGDDATLGGKWTAKLKFKMNCFEDFEFKRTMMLALILFCQCIGADEVYAEEEILIPICKILDKTTRWAKQYQNSLLLTAMQVLDKIIHKHHKQFLACDGLRCMLDIIVMIGKGDYTCHYVIYSLALTVIYKIFEYEAASKEPSDLDVKYVREVLDVVIYRLFAMDLKLTNQKLMSQCINILAFLPLDCGSEREYVEFVVALLQRALQPRSTDLRYLSRLYVSAISLLWKHGLHKPHVFFYFIKLQGVYLLLDFLKNAEFSIQIICLGILCDILEYDDAVSYFVTWQKDGVGILEFLMDLFHRECVQIGVTLLPRGVIGDITYPLMGAIQKEALLNNIYPPETSPSFTDIFFSCRPKIYAIFRLLTNRHGETLEIVNDYYRTFELNLTIDHKITKLLCDHYLTLKMGEMWMEQEIFGRKIGPVSPHKELIQTMVNYSKECATRIQKLQNNWLLIERKNDHIAEEEFYNLLREAKLAGSIRAIHEMLFLARCNNPEFRTILSRDTDTLGIHRTSLLNNFIPNQRILIQSDIILDPYAPKPPEVVSSDSENEVAVYDEPVNMTISCQDISCLEMQGERKKE